MKLEAAQLSSDLDSSGEYFDAEDEPHLNHMSHNAGASAMAAALPLSSTTVEGDPPDVEEDSGDMCEEDMAGIFVVEC